MPPSTPPPDPAAGPPGARELGVVKTVLYYSPGPHQLDDLLAGLAQLEHCTVDPHGPNPRIYAQGNCLRLLVEHEPCAARDRLAAGYVNLVLLDLRDLLGQPGLVRTYAARVKCLLEAMATERDVETRFGFHRVIALVAGTTNREVDALLVELGAIGVGHVVRDESACMLCDSCPKEPRRLAFYGDVLDTALETMTRRRIGKRALCCAGGGITGILFELGALKCLDDCLSPDAVNSFDLYFGISAGAVVTSLIANGYTIDEIMASVANRPGARLPHLDLSLFRLRHLNVRDYQRRLRDIAGRVRAWMRDAASGKATLSLDALLVGYTDMLAPPFHGRAFERQLREIFRRAGATNDFRKLPNRLYLGATDQDAHTHVLFGDEGWDDVPISLAVQASMSINPAFRSTEIRGRFYEDGAVTRTSNFIDAIRKDAGLVFVVNPFVPYVSKDPGFAQSRGIWFNVDQDIRAVTYTRFENMRNLVLRHHPYVNSYTFLPANRLRQLMGVNPLDHRPFLPIWRGAYLSTLQRIQQLHYRLKGDAAVHGLELDTALAEQVAAQLEATTDPQFEDFFPGRKVHIRSNPQRAIRRQPSMRPGSGTVRGGGSQRWSPASAEQSLVLELASHHPGEAHLDEPPPCTTSTTEALGVVDRSG